MFSMLLELDDIYLCIDLGVCLEANFAKSIGYSFSNFQNDRVNKFVHRPKH